MIRSDPRAFRPILLVHRLREALREAVSTAGSGVRQPEFRISRRIRRAAVEGVLAVCQVRRVDECRKRGQGRAIVERVVQALQAVRAYFVERRHQRVAGKPRRTVPEPAALADDLDLIRRGRGRVAVRYLRVARDLCRRAVAPVDDAVIRRRPVAENDFLG